jgi:tetratricopeptide (TPR) repeat protein/serine/threonine protein kinase
MSVDPHAAKAIFMTALDKSDPAERAAYLAEACGSDEGLRQRVELLLKAHSDPGSFLASPPAPPAATIDESTAERARTVIGPYKLLEPIGEGGMGTVWMAQQTEPVKRPVAIKLIKAGMDSKQVIARFEAERQALALMDHANIARVLDAGATSAGRPYFVMELVKGVPITRYCDEHRLPPRQRLELFLPVCQAVQHAHQKGVIHRDLKPSNVLVALYDGKPVPKVIDFGIAKAAGQALTEKTLVTGLGNIVGTLEYMSPEQAEINQLDIDTRSDIYSLGVLLYELLTGSPPFSRNELEKAGMLEMLRVIREDEPSKPSTKLSTSEGLPTLAANRGTEPAKLTRLVRGELDWIVMKALEKDRSRRYETANGFAADVQRYLADEPVLACPPSAKYRLRKFVRRNKRPLLMASVIGMALLLAVGSLGWMASDRAARQARTTSEVNQFLQQAESLYADNKLPEAVAEVQKARGVLEAGRGDEELGQRVRQWLTDLDTAARLEEIRLRLFELEDRDRGYAAYAQVFRDYDIDVEALPDAEVTARIAASQIKLDLVLALGNWALGLRSDPRPQDPARGQRLLAIARAADPDPWRERVQAAVEGKNVRTLRELANGADPARLRTRTLAYLGDSLRAAGDAEAAVAFLGRAQRQHPGDFMINSNLAFCLGELKPPPWDEALAFRRVALAVRPQSAWAHYALGIALWKKKRLDEAIVEYGKAIRLRPGYVHPHHNLGIVLYEQKKLDEAAASFRKAIEIDPKHANAHLGLGNALFHQEKLAQAFACYRKAIALDPKNAYAHNSLGNALRDQNKLPEAIAAFRRAIKLDPKAAYAHNNLGNALHDQNKLPEAIAAFRKAIEIDPKDAVAYKRLGSALHDQKKLPAAIAAYRKAIEIDPKYAVAYSNLGGVLGDQKKIAEAIVACRKAIEIDPKYAGGHYNLGVALQAQGKLENAIACYRKAVEFGPKFAQAYIGLGNGLRAQQKLPEAIVAYRKAIALDPKYALAHLKLGAGLLAQQKLPEAIAAYRKAIEVDLKYANAYIGLGAALRQQKKLPEAIAVCRKAIEIDPKLAGAYNNLGMALRDQQKLSEAIAAYHKAIALDPKYAKPYNGLGNALWAQRKVPEAIAAYRKASALDPKDPVALFILGNALSATGDLDGAIAEYRKVIAIDPKKLNARHCLVVALKRQGKFDEVIGCYRKAIEVDPKSVSAHIALGHALMAQKRVDEAAAEYKKALRLASEAVKLAPQSPFAWHVLGCAHYRAGDWKASIEALEKSCALQNNPKGGDAGQWFVLAMGHWKLGEKEKAREVYDKAVQWMDKNRPKNVELRRFRAEAAELLGIDKKE